MNASVFSYTRKGAQLSLKVKNILDALGYKTEVYTSEKFVHVDPLLKKSVGCIKSAGEAFATNKVIIYIGSCGIAVRAIAPHVVSKTTDPAVISIDEGGNFVIPLLAGHIGGANGIARKLASAIGAQAVVTTATDINGLFAVDEWAARHDYYIGSMFAAKEFSSALVDGKEIGVKSCYPITGKLPKGMCLKESGEIGLILGANEEVKPFKTTLTLLPKVFVLGVGCRRNTLLTTLEELILPQLDIMKISIHAIKEICSVDLKKDEQGLLAFAAKYKLPIRFFTAAELAQQKGIFTASALVQKVVGVDNVCERSAVAASQGKIILPKTSKNGVTMAIAQIPITIDFNKM